jgi:hypothetical protein
MAGGRTEEYLLLRRGASSDGSVFFELLADRDSAGAPTHAMQLTLSTYIAGLANRTGIRGA